MGSNMEGNWQLMSRLEAEKPILLPGSSSYKRTFLFDSSGKLVVDAPLLEEEVLLYEYRDRYAGMKLLRGLWRELEGKRSGTHFPVAVPGPGEAFWCSAGHCLVAGNQMEWRCGYGHEVRHSSPTSKVARRDVLNLNWVRGGWELSELTETSPSDPTHRIPMADALPDFGFMHTSNPDLQPQQLFIPCADQLAGGQEVCVLGFASAPTGKWAQYFLRTDADYARLRKHEEVVPLPNWELDPQVAWERCSLMDDSVCFPHKLVAAPGRVFAATNRMVEHSCSTFPGMSGAPGVHLREPWKLLFVHTGAHVDWRRQANYGYSVNHPLFFKAYVREILPKLLAMPPDLDLLNSDMRRCLHQYLSAHAHLLQDASVLEQVEQYM